MRRWNGITDTTFPQWRNTFAVFEASKARRSRQPEEKRRGLKGLVADQALEILAFKEALGRK